MQCRENEDAFRAKALRFAVNAVNYSKQLTARKDYSLASQFIRSATSIGANVSESRDSESRRDFIHKLKIAKKEASEAAFWLELFQQIEGLSDPTPLRKDLEELQRILGKSLKTANQNANRTAPYPRASS